MVPAISMGSRWDSPAHHPTSFRGAASTIPALRAAGLVGAARRPDTLRIYRSVFEWDPRKAARNFEKHGITFFEAASVFSDPEGLDLPDDAHSTAERRSWRIGMSDEGRVLTVVYAVRRFRDGEAIRIISARAASRKERATYASRED